LGAILAGFGLLFFGIEYLQTGMAGISWNLDAIAGDGPGARWILTGIGILMSIRSARRCGSPDRAVSAIAIA
jgi:phosphate:Na+ symporter